MKLRPTHLSLFALVLIGLFSFKSAEMEKRGDYDWLKQRLDATKAFTVEVFEAMPEDKYTYRPNEDVRTFQAQAYHIVYSIDYFERAFASNGQAGWNPDAEDSKSREELIAWANEKFDSMHKMILESTANDKLTAGIMGYLDHNAHHRGQMVTYLRANGIKPPSYR